eukprot:1838891-Rhodomonas_salina.2
MLSKPDAGKASSPARLGELVTARSGGAEGLRMLEPWEPREEGVFLLPTNLVVPTHDVSQAPSAAVMWTVREDWAAHQGEERMSAPPFIRPFIDSRPPLVPTTQFVRTVHVLASLLKDTCSDARPDLGPSHLMYLVALEATRRAILLF